MKSWISIAFGAAALAVTTFGVSTPAQARSDVGVYIGPGGAAISVGYRHRCRDYWYRRTHPYRCGYGRYYHERYYPNYNYYYDNDYRYRHHRRHHRHHHDWDDRYRDRDYDRRW